MINGLKLYTTSNLFRSLLNSSISVVYIEIYIIPFYLLFPKNFPRFLEKIVFPKKNFAFARKTFLQVFRVNAKSFKM